MVRPLGKSNNNNSNKTPFYRRTNLPSKFIWSETFFLFFWRPMSRKITNILQNLIIFNKKMFQNFPTILKTFSAKINRLPPWLIYMILITTTKFLQKCKIWVIQACKTGCFFCCCLIKIKIVFLYFRIEHSICWVQAIFGMVWCCNCDTMDQWRHQNFFCGGGIEGQNAILRGQKYKNLPKMADFGHFFLLTGGQVGGRASNGGGANAQMPLCPPWCCHCHGLYILTMARSHLQSDNHLLTWSSKVTTSNLMKGLYFEFLNHFFCSSIKLMMTNIINLMIMINSSKRISKVYGCAYH